MGPTSRPPMGPSGDGLVPAVQPTLALAHRADYRLVRRLLRLQAEGATGTLKVEAEGVLTVVRLRDGQPVFVEGGLPSDSVGRLLLSRGRISEAQLAQIEEQRMVMQGRLKFGEVARRLGVIDDDALAAVLRDQIEEKLSRCLHWERAHYTFEAGEHVSQALRGKALAAEPIMLRGVVRHYGPERIEQVLLCARDQAPVLRAAPERLASRFGLDAAGRARLDTIASASSIGQLLRSYGAKPATSGQPASIAHLLAVLALTDQLVLPEIAVPEESGRFVISELARDIQDKGQDPAIASRRPQSGASELPPPITDRPLPGKDKLLADSAFLQGRELLRAGEFGAAADAFREAANLRPGALEYALFAAWSAYLSTGRAAKWREMLVELCDRTMEQDRFLAFAHHVKGQLALEVRDRETARRAFERAIELDPLDEDARRALSGL